MKVLNARAIRVYCAERDLKQEDLAASAGLNPCTLSLAMNGKSLTLKTLFSLHEATGIPIDVLALDSQEHRLSPPSMRTHGRTQSSQAGAVA